MKIIVDKKRGQFLRNQMQIWSQCFYEMLYKTRDVDNCEINELISEIVKLSEEQQVSLE